MSLPSRSRGVNDQKDGPLMSSLPFIGIPERRARSLSPASDKQLRTVTQSRAKSLSPQQHKKNHVVQRLPNIFQASRSLGILQATNSANPSDTPTKEDLSLAVIGEHLRLPASPPRRNLRARKAAQLAPYTMEMQKYRRRLIRNDWEDAVVVTRELARLERERRREREGSYGPVHKDEDNLQEERSTSNAKHNKVTQKRVRRQSSNAPLKVTTNLLGDGMGTSDERLGCDDDGMFAQQSAISMDISPQDAIYSSSDSSFMEVRRKHKRYRIAPDSSSETDSEESDTLASLHSQDHLRAPHSQSLLKNKSAHDIASSSSETDDSDASFLINDVREVEKAKKAAIAHRRNRDYDQLFRVLKRTMPVRMARAHIEDLKAMDREAEEDEDEHNVVDLMSQPESDTTSTLRPGEARRRVRRHEGNSLSRLELDGDSEGDSSRSSRSVDLATQGEEDVESSTRSQTPESDRTETNLFWWEASSRRTVGHPGAQDRDMIDHMLSRRTHPTESRNVNRHIRKQRRGVELENLSRKGVRHKRGGRGAQRPYRERINNQKRASTGKAPRLTFSGDVRDGFGWKLHQEDSLFMESDDIGIDGKSDAACFPTKGSRDFTQAERIAHINSKTDCATPPSRITDKGSTTNAIQRDNQINRSPQSRKHAKSKAVGLQQYFDNKDKNIPEHLSLQKHDAESWRWHHTFSLDFGIRSPTLGIQMSKDSYIGRGRLFDLLHLNKPGIGSDCPLPAIYIFGQELTAETYTLDSHESVMEAFSQESEALFTAASEHDVELARLVARFCQTMEQWANFFCMFISTSKSDDMEVHRLVQYTIQRCNSLAVSLSRLQGPAALDTLLQTKWLKVEAIWRAKTRFYARRHHLDTSPANDDLEEDECMAAQSLMHTLLLHGLHRTMSSIRAANKASKDKQETLTFLNDTSADMWIRLIHLLSTPEDTFDSSPSFWSVFDVTLRQYHEKLRSTKGDLVVAENTWYSIFAIISLSHFTFATGSSSSQSALPSPHWGLVLYALSIVRLRYDEQVEKSLSTSTLWHRDEYIRSILRRTLLLVQSWRWRMEGSEAVLGKLFHLFDAFKLEDLPSEEHTDFPRFLREYDEGLLCSNDKSHRDSAFHLFLRLLAIAAVQAGEQRNNIDKEKAIGRLLSRFSPVRTMSYTEDNVPTILERSCLYNHYSIALLYLYFVPSSFHQRLVQIQQYLRIGTADTKSQIVGIRAMMYAATILRHWSLPLDQSVQWFKSVFERRFQKCEQITQSKQVPGQDFIRQRKIRNETMSLMTVLRAIQYVIHTYSLDKNDVVVKYPDPKLLDPSKYPNFKTLCADLSEQAWTSHFFDSHLCVQNAALALEALEVVRAFILQRNSSTKSTQPAKEKELARNKEQDESQDSYAELFDDADFDDAGLLDAAGYDRSIVHHDSFPPNNMQPTDDLEEKFSDVLSKTISPSLFRLMNSLLHPERRREYTLVLHNLSEVENTIQALKERSTEGGSIGSLIEQSHKTSIAQLLVDCWSLCAWMLVEEFHVRSWSYYFHFGPEDVRRIIDDLAKREVMVRFLIIVLSKASASLSPFRPGTLYHDYFGEIWGILLSSIVSPHLMSQSILFALVCQLEEKCRSTWADGPVLRLVNDTRLTNIQEFWAHRPQILTSIFDHLSSVADQDATLRSATFVALTSMLATIRIYSDQTVYNYPSRTHSHAEQREFFLQTLEHCRAHFSSVLLRGLAIELRKTEQALRDAM